jgi:hypothetical protein
MASKLAFRKTILDMEGESNKVKEVIIWELSIHGGRGWGIGRDL